MKIIKYIIFVLLFLMLFVPMVQYWYQIVKVKPLDGFFDKGKFPDTLSVKTWTNESFQKKFNKAIQDNVGLREPLIRVNNQINYWLFKKTEADAVIGKNNCLYQEGYLLDYCGINFMGKKYINELLRRTKLVQDTLKKSKNVDLIVVYEPGKASFYPEYIPDRYLKQKSATSNMNYLIQRSREIELTYLDLHSWFLSLKTTSQYPVYTTYGVHWTTYGMFKAADSMAKFIESVRNIDMPEMIWEEYKVTPNMRDEDFDIEATLNLWFELPHTALCYPVVSYTSAPNKVKPKLLTIGDSYYWGIIGNHIVDSLYTNHQYWYYNSGIWPDIWKWKNIPDVLNLKEEVEKQDVILVMITELNTYRAFWEFTDQLFQIYYPNEPPNQYYDGVKKILREDYQLKNHRSLALKRGVSLEEVINTEASKN